MTRRRAGFTLIEMMIVMAIIVILVSVAIPFYQKSIIRAKESVLHNNLFAMRSAIDEFTFDKQKAPQSLQDLVSDGYLHDVPRDPITQRNDSWKVSWRTRRRRSAVRSRGSLTSGADRAGQASTARAIRTGS